jgi:DNA-binding MarR family transcriptional regulator
MSGQDLLLDRQVCFLVYSLEREIQAAYRPLLSGLGLTYPQYLAMLALWEMRSATIGELCSSLGLDTGTLSPLLKRLEAAGLVTRERRPDDERSVAVSLTQKGAALKKKALPIPRRLASCLFDDEAEYRELKAILETSLGRLRDRAGRD